MSVTPRAPARLVGGLTSKGLVVALTVRLRDAAAALSERECADLSAELRDLVDEYAPRRPNPAA
jgi:hypothetical protein